MENKVIYNSRNILKVLLPLLLMICSIFFFTDTNKSLSKEHDLLEDVKKVVDTKYIDNKIISSIENNNFDDVEMYQNIANLTNVPISQEVLKRIDDEKSLLNTGIRESKSLFNGFIFGESNNTTELAGSIASDMTVVGDLRDLTTESIKYFNDEEYDSFVLSLAIIGVAGSASEVATAGASTPIKIGTSLLKIAKKGSYLSKGLTSNILSKLKKVVDLNKLKNIDYTNINSIKQTFNTINIDTLKPIFLNVNKINKNTSNFDTLKILKYADNEKSLKKLTKISSKFGKNTRGVLTILGEDALKISKYTFLIILKLLAESIGTIIGIFYFIMVSLPIIKIVYRK